MSKELEALEKIKNAPTIYVGCASDIYTRYSFECKLIETALKEKEKLEKMFDNDEKRLLEIVEEAKMFELVVVKRVNMLLVKNTNDVDEYNSYMTKFPLSKEEYDTLKRSLL